MYVIDLLKSLIFQKSAFQKLTVIDVMERIMQIRGRQESYVRSSSFNLERTWFEKHRGMLISLFFAAFLVYFFRKSQMLPFFQMNGLLITTG